MKRLLVVCFALGSLFASGQGDIHFSQFYSSPLNINPGMTGVIPGSVRAIAQYRNQWGSITVPYTTMAASADFKLFDEKIDNGAVGLGVNFYKDDAGDSKFSTLKYNISAAYSLYLNGKPTNSLTVGFQAGQIQRSMSFADLYWDNQYTGSGFDTNIPSGENEGGTSVSKLDVSSGLYWNYIRSDQFRSFIGLGLFHLNSPDVSFAGAKEKLLMKYVVHGGFEYLPDKNSNYSFIPNMVIVSQGPNSIVNVGSDFKYMLQGKSRYTGFKDEVSLSVGGYYRFKDAFFGVLRFNYSNFTVGASYDFTLSDLTNAARGLGGMEFMVMYRAGFGNSTASIKMY